MNIYKNAREKSGLSAREISEKTGIDRRSLKAIEDGKLETAKLKDLVGLSQFLNVNLYQVIRDHFHYVSGEIYEEDMDAVINRLVQIQMDLIYDELNKFAKIVKYRLDDFDVKKILSDKSNLHRLIALNSRLQNGQISSQEALSIFKPIRGSFSKRKRGGS